MKQLTCEMCGSTDLMKQEGVFVCQTCGTKYSVEEAKKMMVEGTVNVVGTVSIDNSGSYDRIVELARDAYNDKRFESAYDYYCQAVDIKQNVVENVLRQGLSILGKEAIQSNVPSSCTNRVVKAIDLIKSTPKVEAKKEPKQEAPKEETPAEAKAEITYDDFAKLDLRVVEVLECSKVEKADKLLQFKLKMGDEIRTVVSGIAKFYESPEELVGKKLVLVANLAPKKIRGIVSHGMLLSAATDDDSLLQVLQVTHEDIPSGATVC